MQTPEALSSLRPRVALLAPYWTFWEVNARVDLRADRRALTVEVERVLLSVADVVLVGEPDGFESGAALGARLREVAPDAIVVAQSMAVPPGYAMRALEEVDDVPVVVFVVGRVARHGAEFDRSDITVDGGTVGGPQLVNVLVRRGIAHDIVVGRIGQPGLDAELGGAVLAAAAACRLRRARILRVGHPIEGYDCVDCDPQALRDAVGAELVPVAPGEVQRRYRDVTVEQVATIEAEVRAGWTLDPDVERDECLARSLRMAAALAWLDDELKATAGAMNCHVPEIRFAQEPGITPCFALGRETSRGIPWTCAGDVVTAVAMTATKLLGGAALYHEIEGIDYERGELLLANSGEHDVAWADPAQPMHLLRNGWYDGNDARCGACACFGPRAGPATLVGFTPHPQESSGFRFVVAEGTLSARNLSHTGTANGAFRFAGRRDLSDSWVAWARAGVNHHSSATPGHLGTAVETVARHLGIGCVSVARADGKDLRGA